MARVKRMCVLCGSGLAGKTDLEEARADMVVDCVADTIKPVIKVLDLPDEMVRVRKLLVGNRPHH